MTDNRASFNSDFLAMITFTDGNSDRSFLDSFSVLQRKTICAKGKPHHFTLYYHDTPGLLCKDRGNSITLIRGHYQIDGSIGNLAPSSMIDYIYGSFVIIHISDSKGLQIVTDAGTSVPVYYYSDPDKMVCSNRLDWILLSFPDLRWAVNWNRILSFLVNGLTPGSDTFIENIDMLKPHRVYLWNYKRWEVSDDYLSDYFCQNNENRHLVDEMAMISEQFFNVLSRRNNCFVSLSAGFDSRVNLACSYKCFQPANFFAASYGDPSSFDVEKSRLLSDKIGVQHKWVPLGSILSNRTVTLGDFIEDDNRWTAGFTRHSFWYRAVFGDSVSSDNRLVEISGVGGELLRQYYFKKNSQLPHFSYENSQASLNKCAEYFSQSARDNVRTLNEYFYQAAFADMPKGLNKYEQMEWFCMEHRFAATWGNRYLSGADYCPAVYPSLDYRLLRCAFSMSPELRSTVNIQDYIIRRFCPRIADIPYQNNILTENTIVSSFLNATHKKYLKYFQNETKRKEKERNRVLSLIDEEFGLLFDLYKDKMILIQGLDEKDLRKWPSKVRLRFYTTLKYYHYLTSNRINLR